MVLQLPIFATLVSLLLVCPFCAPAIVPFRDSIEIVFTPEDVKRTTDYVLWKVPAVKHNFKTTVKQKMLNLLLNRELQDVNPNPPFFGEDIGEEGEREGEHQEEKKVEQQAHKTKPQEDVTQAAAAGESLLTVEIDITKPHGIVHSVLWGPSPNEKKTAKVTIHGANPPVTSNSQPQSRSRNTVSRTNPHHTTSGSMKWRRMTRTDSCQNFPRRVAKLKEDHIGYLRPTRIKNDKHDFGQKAKKLPASHFSELIADGTTKTKEMIVTVAQMKGWGARRQGNGGQLHAKRKGKVNKKTLDPFYDDD
ncbi:hypothetical protein Cantr_05696 [Candida viswanathii]|uniref:Uncharacterized protein n=1 Tax=Candida viswanathii TaxID=5486 RepID=A0A367XS33_9ASCO|nr:hypothetical protein Cantr_05696 [Candida viswanathii]